MFGMEESVRAVLVDAFRTVLREELGELRQVQLLPPRALEVEHSTLTLKEAAAAAGKTTKTISNWCREGKLTPRGEGRGVRIRESELRAVLDKRKHSDAGADAEDLAVSILRKAR